MSRIRNGTWKEDKVLKTWLKERVLRRYKQEEILCEAVTLFDDYAWSKRTLALRLKHFNIRYTNGNVDIGEVINAVSEELQGPGQNLGYRAMTQKVVEKHQLQVPRDTVYLVMKYLDPAGLEARGGVGEKNRKEKTTFKSKGSNWTLSLDGHDKLTGWQKTQFPLCVYGGQDTYSGAVVFLKIWTSNNKPDIIGRYYYDYLAEARVLPERIRIDKGTETGTMTAIHSMLHKAREPTRSVKEIINKKLLFGASTENKIERWWGELHRRMEGFFKTQLQALVESGEYQEKNKLHENLLAYVYIPIIQRELDEFREVVWNHSRGRKQRDKELPTGIPAHIYDNPEYYGGQECGTWVTEAQLEEVAELTKVLEDDHDFLTPELREICETLLPEPEDIASKNAMETFIELKDAVMDVTN